MKQEPEKKYPIRVGKEVRHLTLKELRQLLLDLVEIMKAIPDPSRRIVQWFRSPDGKRATFYYDNGDIQSVDLGGARALLTEEWEKLRSDYERMAPRNRSKKRPPKK